jgi:GABA(A) receptor-associated protein
LNNIIVKLLINNQYKDFNANYLADMFSSVSFKKEYTFAERLDESKRIFLKHPDKIPIICERSPTAGKDCPYIDKKKYLVQTECTFGQFLYVIRKQLKLPSDKALFLFTNNNIPPTTSLIKEIYARHKDEDGYLYVSYSQENTFGHDILF